MRLFVIQMKWMRKKMKFGVINLLKGLNEMNVNG